MLMKKRRQEHNLESQELRFTSASTILGAKWYLPCFHFLRLPASYHQLIVIEVFATLMLSRAMLQSMT